MIYHLGPNIQRKIWGGKNLEQIKGLVHEPGLDPVGETWEISAHVDGPSFFQGDKLTIDEGEEELPYLVKFLDTGDYLSVQVHPGDEYARLHENSSGKTECWVIIKASPEVGIYLGLKSGVSKESFEKGLLDKANMSEFLNFYPANPGDFYFVPAGSIHAIGPGILMAEVQQSSGITYRVWDWNRVDSMGVPRKLHVKKSLDVINFDPKANSKEFFRVMQNLFDKQGIQQLVHHSCFNLSLVNLEKGESIDLFIPSQKRLSSLLNLRGKVKINNEDVTSFSAVLFRNESNLQVTAVERTSFLFLI